MSVIDRNYMSDANGSGITRIGSTGQCMYEYTLSRSGDGDTIGAINYLSPRDGTPGVNPPLAGVVVRSIKAVSNDLGGSLILGYQIADYVSPGFALPPATPIRGFIDVIPSEAMTIMMIAGFNHFGDEGIFVPVDQALYLGPTGGLSLFDNTTFRAFGFEMTVSIMYIPLFAPLNDRVVPAGFSQGQIIPPPPV